VGALVCCLLLLAADPLASTADAGARPTRALPSESSVEPHILMSGVPGAVARRAVRGARLRLMAPSCSRLLSEFKDSAGEPLQSRLDGLGLSAPDYVAMVVFAEGSTQRACATRIVLGVTQPGSRVVFLCPRFVEAELRDPRFAEAIVIHEMLHSLGLGENPPSSWEITGKVLRSCLERPPLRGD